MNPIDEILLALLAVCVMAMGSLMRPTYARCPDGWYVAEGAPTSGASACRVEEPEKPSPCAGKRRCPDLPDLRPRIPIQIYCTKPTRPVIVERWQAIACRRAPAS